MKIRLCVWLVSALILVLHADTPSAKEGDRSASAPRVADSFLSQDVKRLTDDLARWFQWQSGWTRRLAPDSRSTFQRALAGLQDQGDFKPFRQWTERERVALFEFVLEAEEESRRQLGEMFDGLCAVQVALLPRRRNDEDDDWRHSRSNKDIRKTAAAEKQLSIETLVRIRHQRKTGKSQQILTVETRDEADKPQRPYDVTHILRFWFDLGKDKWVPWARPSDPQASRDLPVGDYYIRCRSRKAGKRAGEPKFLEHRKGHTREDPFVVSTPAGS